MNKNSRASKILHTKSRLEKKQKSMLYILSKDLLTKLTYNTMRIKIKCV